MDAEKDASKDDSTQQQTSQSYELPPLQRFDPESFRRDPQTDNSTHAKITPTIKIPSAPTAAPDSVRPSPRTWITHSVSDSHFSHTLSHTTSRPLHYYGGSIPEGLTSKDIFQTFHSGFKQDQPNYSSLALVAEVKLMEAKAKGEQLGLPNAFIAAVACEILDKMSALSGHYGLAVTRFKGDLFRAIYVDYEDGWLENSIEQVFAPSHSQLIASSGNEVVSKQTHAAANKMNAPFLSTQSTYFDLLKKVTYECQTLEIDRDKWIGRNMRLRAAASKGPLSVNSLITRWQNLLLTFTFDHWRRTNIRFKQEVNNNARYLRCWMNFTLFKAFNHWRRRTQYVVAHRHKWAMEKKEGDLYEVQEQTAQVESVCDELASKLKILEDELNEAREQKRYNDFLMKEKIKAEKTANSVYIRFGSQLTEPVAKDFIRTMSHVSRAETRSLYSILQAKESIQNLLDLSPDKLIMRWVNFHMEKAQYARRIENFSTDFRDSSVYTYLLRNINPDACSLAALDEIDFSERARRVVQNAANIGFTESITVDNIVNASPENADLHLLFLIQLFCQYPQLQPIRSANAVYEEEEEDVTSGLPILTEIEYRDCGYEGNNPIMLRRCREFRALMDLWSKITRVAESDEISSKELIHQLGLRFSSVKHGITTTSEYSNQVFQNFATAVSNVEAFSRKLIGHRLRGEPITLEDPREQKDFDQYTKINPRKLHDLLSKFETPEKEVAEIEAMLVKNFTTIKSVFRNYAKGYAISSFEFWEFVKDCRLPSSTLPASAIDGIFLKSNETLEEETTDDENNPDKELIPAEFVECLLRISAAKWSKTTLPLHMRLQKLIKGKKDKRKT
eukprot:TRINITY_DN2311_c0_g1_i14.p1 TRINITY_DN2311_c0_g1~~TRINITY_DN2311_c0_g1_i14.p1  ORF type:complete len:845 (+),score=162.08 TRINITY_DN2311_c0_g1_i14:67-2601(+)